METLENVMRDIDWENDFDSDSSDIEDYFPGFSQFEDQLNVSISTNDLMDQCADLFDLDNEELSPEFGENSDNDITLSELIPPKKKKGEPGRDSVWKHDNEFLFPDIPWPRVDRYEAALEKLGKKQLISRFFDYLPLKFIDSMVEYTGKRAVQNGAVFHLNLPIMLRFIALSIRMSIYRLPSLKHYFSNTIGDVGAKHYIDKATFFKIRANLKCIWDSDIPIEQKKRDPLWKVRPIMESVRSAMLSVPVPPDNVCIDEQIIPFTGGMPNKVVIKTKPHPVGLKMFCLAAPSGTILNFVPYCGSRTFSKQFEEMPQGQAAVLSLCEKVEKGCTLFLDRFFTGLGVVKALLADGIFVTGTVQRNRLPRGLRDKLPLENVERGSSTLLVNSESTMALTSWKDSKNVLVLSSRHTKVPETTCKRWVKGQKSKKSFPQPQSVAAYNANMGGVDLTDRMLALYPHWAYRTNKWTVRVILHFFMIVTTNTWFERAKTTTFFDHALLLCDELLAHSKQLEQKLGILSSDVNSVCPTPSRANRISDGHLPQHSGKENASRCRYEDAYKKSCGGKSRWICMKCKVPLCLNERKNCFQLFHLSK